MGLKDVLVDDLPDEELARVITSFDIVGDVAIIKVPDSLEHRKGVIADAVMEQHSNVNTVVRKVGERSGEFRVADYETLRGDTTETVHREHGCRYRLDPTTLYFSERLGHERERVATQVGAGETVFDMFAGVGPFSIMIARTRDPDAVHAVEKNPAAVDYLEQNIDLNNVDDVVTAHPGDVREVAPDVTADRVIMNLPGSSEGFVDLAVERVRDGGTVHYYDFVAEDDLDSGAAEDAAVDLFADADADVSIDTVEVCGHYNPAVERVCFDVAVR
ncbi:MAG: class I SAM-dependent methyltransferase family protein [Candidatus Nanohaloarchaea archaeon]